jgi:Holliday junction resolvasome RuvABC ATP-dependent DNA helicase subunit
MILLRVNDYKIVDPKSSVAKILEKIGIFKGGLNQNDIKYLKAFVNNQKFLGIKTISQITQFDQKFIENKIEPYLIQIKYLVKTNNGRMLSNLA